MDRLVNIRMTADLSQIIQQFTQLNNTINTVTSSLGGVTGSNMNIGGMAGGMNLPGAMGGVAGAGGTMPGTGVTNPRTSNRGGGAAANSYSSIGRADGRNVTSMMFGLSQIGFALEDYQYAGWRGVMNNVPWIANALTSMVAPAAAPYALLGTAIGVPLANMAYENMSVQTRDKISQMFGGVGMSANDTRSAEIDQMQQMLDKIPGGSYRRYRLERNLSYARRQEGLSQAGFEALRTDYAALSGDREERMGLAGDFFQTQGEQGRFSAIDSRIEDTLTTFSRDDKRRAERLIADEYNKMSMPMQVLNDSGSFLRSAGGFISGTGDGDTSKRLLDGALERVKKEKVNWANELAAEIEKIRKGEKPNWDRMLDLADKMGPDVYFEIRALRREYTRASDKVKLEKSEQATAVEEDAQYAAEEQGRLERLGQGAGMASGRYSSQIGAIIAGSRSMTVDNMQMDAGQVAGERIKDFLAKQGVPEDIRNEIANPKLLQGIRDAEENRKKPDEKIWEENSQQWIANVKSDLLQAQNAAWKNGRFNQQIYNSYIYRIKTKIRDDLVMSGVSRKNAISYAEMIFNAAYKEAQESYTDAVEVSRNQLQVDARKGIRVDHGMVHNAAMQNLVGEMSDDLTAVYGNAQANTFMMNRIYQQQLRRRQIMLNRFQR